MNTESADERRIWGRVAQAVGEHGFILGLVAAVALAWMAPGPGAKGGWLHAELLTRVGIAVIFLLQGLTLSIASLVRGAASWKLHLLVQGFTFLVFPAMGWALDLAVGDSLSPSLRAGCLYLCVLPSTIKTAVVFSTLAGGDAAAAVFNATLSSLLGVLATPLWVQVLLGADGGGSAAGAFWPVLHEVGWLIVCPLGVGMLLRPLAPELLEKAKPWVGRVSAGIVLGIVYTAFCASITEGVWRGLAWGSASLAAALALVLFAVATALVLLGARLLGLGRADTTTALFCAPQKTLATGAPLAKIIFAGRPDVGLILLPLLFYHPLQLLIGGLIVSRLRKRQYRARSAGEP